MRLPTAIAIAAAASLTLGAAAHAQDKPADKPAAAKRECFWTRNVTSFAAPDDHTVYVRVGVREVYKFDLMISCPDIDWNQSLALVSTTGSVCDHMDAEIVSHAQGLGRQRCPISHMHKLTPEEIAALPKRAKP
jgi:hypothetical protein